jgi:uncharacterized membrane protein
MDAMVKPWHDDSREAPRFENHGGSSELMRIDPPAAASPSARLPLLDAARGLAVVAMVVYHFSWDLRYFGYIASDVEGAFRWRVFAHSTAGAFLLIVGISLVLSTRRGFNAQKFLRRLGVLVAAALAITLVTYLLFPDSYIFFGVLHHIALASALGLLFLRLPIPVVIGALIACFFAPPLLSGPTFDRPWLLWLGLETEFPRTNDFVPLLPWFGVVLAGIAAARVWAILAPHAHKFPLPVGKGAQLALPSRIEWPLVWLGRQSLLIYLLHQPILFGVVYLASRVYPPDFLAFQSTYIETCQSSCIESEVEENICQKTCACAAERAQAEGLWSDLMRQTLTPPREQRYFDIVNACQASAASGG